MFQFIHTADLHLDAPLRSLALKNEDLSELVGTATRTALERIVGTCIDERVQALIIAGDLFDGDIRSMKTAAFLTAQLELLHKSDILVFMIRGNHDAESVITKELSLPPNVHVFTGHGGTHHIKEHNVALHGVSFAKPHAPESLLPKYPKPVPDCVNIGLLHTSLSDAQGHDTYAPCSLNDLKAFGYDYWALGHIHKRQIHCENPFVVMPGMPQGRDIGETGMKSITLVSCQDNKINIEERPTSCVEFNRVTCSLDKIDDWRTALEQINQIIKATSLGPLNHNVLRLTLTGQTALAWRIRRDFDLFFEQVNQLAEQTGNVWIEKIENELMMEGASRQGHDARGQLLNLMGELSQDDAFFELAAKDIEKLIAELPQEIRGEFGEEQSCQRAMIETFLNQGIEQIGAMMMGDTTGDKN